MGSRLLREWLTRPLRDVEAIGERQDGVEWAVRNPLERAGAQEVLRAIPDLGRLAGKIGARSAGPREHRNVPLGHGETVDPDRFHADGTWSSPPAQWTDDVDARLDAAGIVGRVREAIDALPGNQREVVLLRDVDGLSSAETCSILGISEGNQRVLLHRGRAGVRQLLGLGLGKV